MKSDLPLRYLSSFGRRFRFGFGGIIILSGWATPILADSARAVLTELHGREAYTLENDTIRISMLTGGGFIGEVRFRSGDPQKAVNPLRVPHYATIDPQNYNPVVHQSTYGSRLGAGYMGNFLCFPFIGGTTDPREREAGHTTHGEALGVKWEIEPMVTTDGVAKLVAAAELPVTRYRVRRTLTLRPGETVIRVDEEVENLEEFARPYQWGQHLTFGDPFVGFDRNFADAPVAKILFPEQQPDDAFDGDVDWPQATDPTGNTFDASAFGSDTGERFSRVWLMDPERSHTWVTVFNREHRVLIGHVFSKAQNPWILDWQENRKATNPPWDGKAVARALVVGTGAFGMGLQRSAERGEIFDTPTIAEIGGREILRQSYLIFLAEIDDGFRGVEDLQVADDSITVIERDTGARTTVKGGGTL